MDYRIIWGTCDDGPPTDIVGSGRGAIEALLERAGAKVVWAEVFDDHRRPVAHKSPGRQGLRGFPSAAGWGHVCTACRTLSGHGIDAATLTGGTKEWVARGHELHRPADDATAPRAGWAMERQVRLTAGAVVLAGLGLSALHPAWLLASAGVSAGLVFSAVTDTCGMAALLSRLPHNRPRAADLDSTLAALAPPHA